MRGEEPQRRSSGGNLLTLVAPLLAPALALAGDHASFHLSFGAPGGPPNLAVIQPGVQVVVVHCDEVFYTGGRYWAPRDGQWYSAGHHADAFAYVEPHRVPSVLTRYAPGAYRHYRPSRGHGDGHGVGPGHGDGAHTTGAESTGPNNSAFIGSAGRLRLPRGGLRLAAPRVAGTFHDNVPFTRER